MVTTTMTMRVPARIRDGYLAADPRRPVPASTALRKQGSTVPGARSLASASHTPVAELRQGWRRPAPIARTTDVRRSAPVRPPG